MNRHYPRTLGLFQKRFTGDDCLLELARLRFQQASMGAEMYAGTPEELEHDLQFRPTPQAPVVVHLDREFNLAKANSRQRIAEFASRFAGRIYGLVLHDHPNLAAHPEQFQAAADEVEASLKQVKDAPWLFLEYAAGLQPAAFIRFFEATRDLSRLSACIDTGHVGIWQARQAYSRLRPGEDIYSLKPQPPELQERLPDVETAVSSALPVVLELIGALSALGKPLHFHLHDGHPLSTYSPYGISDHLSFLMELPLRFNCRGRRTTPLLYEPSGLSRIVAKALEVLTPEQVSFTLEIHPLAERRPLEDAAPLFSHWIDKTNAEMMNHWLWTLTRNHALLLDACKASLEER